MRTVATTATRSVASRLSRNRRKSADEVSTHCRSSTTTTTGPRASPASATRAAVLSKQLPARRLVGRPDRRTRVLAQRPQQIGHREVRQARLTQVDALRPQDEGARQAVEQRPHQPALAHARLTGDQDRARAPVRGTGHHLVQDRELALPSDERDVVLAHAGHPRTVGRRGPGRLG